VFQAFQSGRQEGTLNAIEQHTKIMALALLGISQPGETVKDSVEPIFFKIGDIRNVLRENVPMIATELHHAALNSDTIRNKIVDLLPWVVDFTHQTASSLKDFIQPNVAIMTASLRAIEHQIVSSPQVQKAASTTSAAQTITINVNGATDPAAVAKSVMDLLKAQSPVFV
jgi:hypothetical protein